MSNIGSMRLFRKFSFLSTYYKVKEISFVKVVTISEEILGVRLRLSCEDLSEDLTRGVHEILFLDEKGEKLHSKGYGWRILRYYFTIFLSNTTVGREFLKMPDKTRSRVKYIVLRGRVMVKRGDSASVDYESHLTLCKPPENLTVAERIEELVNAADVE